MSAGNGVVEDVYLSKSMNGTIIQRMEWWEPGDKVKDYLTHKLGIFLIKFNTLGEMQEFTNNSHEMICVKLNDDW